MARTETVIQMPNDTELNGFHVLCHRTSKSYYLQHDVAGKSVIVCLGRTNQVTAQKARKLALTRGSASLNNSGPKARRQPAVRAPELATLASITSPVPKR